MDDITLSLVDQDPSQPEAERSLLFRMTPAAFDDDRAWWGQALATAAYQQGDKARAQQDLERLKQLDPKLAASLESAIKGDGAGTDRGGVAAQYE